MTRGIYATLLILLLVSLAFISCATEPEVVEEPVVVEVKPDPPKEEAPVVEKPEPEPPKEEEPADPPPSEEEPEEEVFVVSEEVYTETFEDIRKIIDDLNSIIRDENYDRWLRYLASEYIEHFGSSEILKENSDQPLLKKYGIKLNHLRDYFKYVVAPSRADARLDDLVFIDNEHVKAIMIIKDRRTILYQLTKIDGVWKIGL